MNEEEDEEEEEEKQPQEFIRLSEGKAPAELTQEDMEQNLMSGGSSRDRKGWLVFSKPVLLTRTKCDEKPA